MSSIDLFPPGQIESLARALGEAGTGSDITRFFMSLGIEDKSGMSTKWRRLNWAFLESQRKHRCGNHVGAFIQAYMDPARFVGRDEEFDEHRDGLNTILSFAGLNLGDDGRLFECKAARTLTEAEQRRKTIEHKFKGRRIHGEVLKYCKVELLQDNYFHAVFEASKGLAQRIREMSGVEGDGAKLVDQVFSVDRPVLAFNTLQTETERSEHKGIAALLKGCFAAVRNPLAHEPKILWEGEDDAVDYLSLISLLHRRLDESVKTNLGGTP